MMFQPRLAFLGGLVLLAACDPTAPDATLQAVDRTSIKADLLPNPNLSCAGHCGQVVFDLTGYCGCDAACATFNDCCNDNAQQCASGACDYDDPDRDYLGKSVAQCAAMMIKCDPGWDYFMDDCGCGCVKQAAPPPCDYNNPDRDYLGKSVAQCAAMMIKCDPGWDYFMDSCGCGCVKKSVPPCNYNDPKRKYYGKSASKCAAMYFVCDPGWDYFMDSCGCGCEDTAP